MSEKKNIDRLFQEKFKDFEAAPPEFVWDNIHEALQKKKKRRAVPLWLQLSGAAAVVVLGLLVGMLYLNGNGANTSPVVIQHPGGGGVVPSQKTSPSFNPGGNPNVRESHSPTGAPRPNDALVNTGAGIKGTDTTNNIKDNVMGAGATGKVGLHTTTTVRATSANTAVAHNDTGTPENPSGNNINRAGRTRNGRKPNRGQVLSATATNQHTGVAYNAASTGRSGRNNANSATNAVRNTTSAQGAYNNNTGANPANNSVGGVVASTATKGKTSEIGSLNRAGAPVSNNIPSGTNTTGLAGSNTKGNDNTGVSDTNIKDNNTIAINTPLDTTAVDKNIVLNEKSVAEVAIDTVKPENELEKLLKEKEQGKDKDKAVAQTDDTSKWNVKPQLAPVFYSSMSKGSPIDAQFAGNSKNYKTDLSYGLGVTYAVSSKFTVRSGVNTVNLNYATQDVQFYASLSGQTNNVSAHAKSAAIVVEGQQQGGFAATDPFTNQMPKETFNGSMMQKTGYVEVPVEVAYALLDKKFGINIIGGVSTLFLNQNNVSVISNQGFSTNVGEAQNLNNIHFSTNVGLGFKYRFLKSFEANFEPTFKYQVNTFSRDAGNFKPYFIGLYSGISFSF